ncbi:uncharacterized protein LAJ45_09118 [Morchella importuna]|uniref:Zinc finger CHCC-type domain-containing protein n=1 Tax=Morchella conica CCBAS932 TaxID=1392247 RepID=A0A3N4KQ01_9PEZI|nr:uncharacterized protein LAJ45_09118 [Morchella importuna]KAH8146744.1 hypothetical protein LAJ45_09118 [Morchella importuna]RPB12570.1 hypothetical protein P167DRAFT_523130 [Morchella conica CCBAS932]
MFRPITPLTRTLLRPLARSTRTYSSTPPVEPTTNATTVHDTGSTDPAPLRETALEGQKARVLQAPNRATTWSRSQQPRELAMVGPRFEQTILERQPAAWAAIELIHQQPVRWSEKRVVACDGGGGPMGHPRVFINVDKPEIVPCGYCGLPFAHVHHKEHLSKLEKVDYPLE